MVCALVALAVACGVTLRSVESAPAQDAPSLLGVSSQKGYIAIAMLAEPESVVTFYEQIGDSRVELGQATTTIPNTQGAKGLASIPAIPWTCARAVRTFVGVAKTKDGRTDEATNVARTPDCTQRINLLAPSRVEPGEDIEISIRDRWQVGDLPMRLCVSRPKAGRSCSKVKLKPKQFTLDLQRAAGSKVGLLDIDLVFAGRHQHLKVGVGVKPPAVRQTLPVILATGDSLMEGIDTILGQQLKKRYRVIAASRPGTGVSKDNDDERWTAVARKQVSAYKPSITVLLLGGNDGFPMAPAGGGDRVPCCGQAWQDEYLNRITNMAGTYERNGRGKLIYALLPPPKRDDLKEQMAAVNTVIRRLADKNPEIELVHLDEIFGPEYHAQINGTTVRDPDGLHFSLPGQRIAVKAIIAAIRKAEAAVPAAR